MLEIMLLGAMFLYLMLATNFLIIWLEFFKKETNLCKEDREISLQILAIASLFWPIVVPISYVELLNKKMGDLSKAERI